MSSFKFNLFSFFSCEANRTDTGWTVWSCDITHCWCHKILSQIRPSASENFPTPPPFFFFSPPTAVGHVAVCRRRDGVGFCGRRLRLFNEPLNDPLGCSCGKKQLQCPSNLSVAERLVSRFGPCFVTAARSVFFCLFVVCCFFSVLMDCPARAARHTVSLCETHCHERIYGRNLLIFNTVTGQIDF